MYTVDASMILYYFQHLAIIFHYSSIYLQVLLLLFFVLIWIIPSKRSITGFSTLGILIDNILALVAYFAMSPQSSLTIDELWSYYILWNSLVFILMMIYIYARLYIHALLVNEDLWNRLHLISYLFPCTIAPMIFVNSGLLFLCGLIWYFSESFLLLSECLFI